MATPTLPTSPDRQGMVGIEADLSGQVEGDGEAGGAVGQQIFVALIGLFGVAHAGVLAHGPQPAAIHGGLHAAGVGIIAGVSDFAFLVAGVQIGRRVQGVDWDVGGGLGIGRGAIFGFWFVGHEEGQ